MAIQIDDDQLRINAANAAAYESINKLSAYATIQSVEERFEQINQRRDPQTGELLSDRRSLGWYIRISESSAVHVGDKQPPARFMKGARVKHSIELAPEGMTTVEMAMPVPTVPGGMVAEAVNKATEG